MEIYKLVSENLSGLGGPMGTESTSINFVKYFTTVDKAEKYAEKEFGKTITWKKYGRELNSGDLRFVMYHISKIEIEE
jgi:hypothetical protein